MKRLRLSLLFIVLLITMNANAVIDSGICGENVTWVLNDDGKLVISGAGAMFDFENCKAPWYKNKLSFKTLEIEEGVTSLGNYSFSNCSKLQSVTIANTVERICDGVFSYCSAMTSIIIPSSVKSIGVGAFGGCTALTSLSIPNTVESIGLYAFSSVRNIYYSGSATGAPWEAKTLNGCVDGDLVYTDDQKTRISACSSFVNGSLIIPNTVTSIANRAFSACKNLTSVTIPNSVNSIDDWAFSGCNSLTEIFSYAENPPTMEGTNVFYGCLLQNATLYVPTESIEAYKSADVWNNFGKIFSIGNKFYIEDFSVTQGETVDVNIILQNSDDLSAFQADVVIPEQLTIVPQYNAETAEIVPFLLTTRKSTNHVITCSEKGNNTIHLLVNSLNDETFLGNDGALVTFKVKANDTYTGTTQIKVSGISFFDPAEKEYPMDESVSNVTVKVNTNIASGISGTCKWVIKEGGALTVQPSEGESGTLEDWGESTAPWSEWAAQIQSAVFEKKISLSTCRSMFADCTNMQSVDLTNVKFQNVTNVDFMFSGCTNLSTIYSSNTVPVVLNTETFSSLPTLNTCILYVPKSSIRLYKEADGWKNFKYILTTEPNNTKFHINDQNIERGSMQTISVDMENLEDVASFQMDIKLPDGISFVTGEMNKPLLTDRANGFTLSSQVLSNGNLRLLVVNMEDEPIATGTGQILTFNINVPDDMQLGNYTASLLDMIVTPYSEGADKETTSNVDWNITIYKTYSVSVATEDDGKGIAIITGATEGKVREGSSVTLTATPSEGYEFARWSDNSKENPYSITVMENINLIAYFTPLNYNITFSVDGVDDVLSLPYNSIITKPADPVKMSYVFMGWSPDFVEGVTVPLNGAQYIALFAKKGDLDRDDELDVSDVTRIIRYILYKQDDSELKKIADVNEDGEVDVMDVSLIINCILNEGTWKSAKSVMAMNYGEYHMTDFIVGENGLAQSIVFLTGDNVTNIQFDITVPQGVSVTDVSIVGCTSDHKVFTHEYKEGTTRVLCVSLNNEPICMSGNNITITLDVNGAAESADVSVDNIVLTTTNVKIKPEAITKKITSTTGMNAVNTNSIDSQLFNAAGMRMPGRSDGLNIIRKSNGSIKKAIRL